ncbi:MAG: hypothetical protein E6H66_08180 [Betaproteobacteria bacterium]|nr:MAG: hypothetical protein E6H66_08180 [Betaproteobacteria bacterium]
MKLMPQSWSAFLFRHPLLTFILMGAFFLSFGVLSVNLFFLLKANIKLFIDYGLMVIDDGALDQLLELLGQTYLCVMFLAFFSISERILVKRLTAQRLAALGPPPRSEDQAS